ncbi:MAG: hypothetical protein ABH875_04330 [Candidatus Omnitrophota bacterium]
MTRKLLAVAANSLILLIGVLWVSAGFADGAPQKDLTYDSKGRRDPFIPLITRNVKISAGLEGVQGVEDITLEGIVWDSGGGSIAILNGVIVKEGDEIASVKIETITENNIILYINKIKHNIALGEEGAEGEEKAL